MLTAGRLRGDALRGAAKAPVKRGASRTATRGHGRTAVGSGIFSQLTLPWLKIAVATMVLVVIYFGYQLSVAEYMGKVAEFFNRPVSQVVVDGQFEVIEKGYVETLVQAGINGDFVDLNIAKLKRDIELDPWIERVRVTRIWPDILEIKIFEEKAIARWGQEGFINRNGEVVKVQLGEKLKHLPVFIGEEAKINDIARWYSNSQAMLVKSGLTINGIRVSDKNFWTFKINNDIDVYVGDANKQEKLEQFLMVFEHQLKQKTEQIESIDLRYKQSLAVAWKDGKI